MKVSSPRAAAMARGTEIRPSTTARRTGGFDPDDVTARRHSTQASDPVTKRLGSDVEPDEQREGVGWDP